MKIRIYLLLASLFFLSACGGKRQTFAIEENAGTLQLRYASNLSIARYKSYTMATLLNPWDTTEILHTYILVPKNQPLPEKLPEGTIIRIPVSNAVIYSTVHGSLFRQIGANSSIGGLCDCNFIKDSTLLQSCLQGKIANTGNSVNPNIEKIIELHPDIILLSPYKDSNGYGKIEKLNIPILECADYLETSALGRAEWMRFYGILTGHAHTADSLFAVVERNYLDLQKLAQKASHRPKLFSELRYGGVWYVPCGNSPSAKIYADAGMDYTFRTLKGSGSAGLSFEQVFEQAHDAEFWIFKYNQAMDKTYRELEQEYAPYANFQAFKKRHIFACNTARNSFFDETPFRPDWLLRDLIVISHPELLPNQQARYFKSLNE